MGVNSLPKTVTRQRRDCDLNPGPSAPESSTLTTPPYNVGDVKLVYKVEVVYNYEYAATRNFPNLRNLRDRYSLYFDLPYLKYVA